MIIKKFIETPCPICKSKDFLLYNITGPNKPISRLFRKKDKLNGRDINTFEASFSIDLNSDEINIITMVSKKSSQQQELLYGNMVCSYFKIHKECNKNRLPNNEAHYKVASGYITREPKSSKLNVPKTFEYESFILHFAAGEDPRIPEEGGTLRIENRYDTQITLVNTVDCIRQISLIPVSRFDFTDPVGVLNKIESLLVLL